MPSGPSGLVRRSRAAVLRDAQEQLGDLKLYRVPETTDIASHQMKQVRLLDRFRIPVESFYRVDLDAKPRSFDTVNINHCLEAVGLLVAGDITEFRDFF